MTGCQRYDRETFKRMWAENIPLEKIVEAFGCHRTTVLHMRRELGFPWRPIDRPPPKAPKRPKRVYSVPEPRDALKAWERAMPWLS